MKWEVSGVDRRTGGDRKAVIEAENEASAREHASHRGLVVESVRQTHAKAIIGDGDSAAPPQYLGLTVSSWIFAAVAVLLIIPGLVLLVLSTFMTKPLAPLIVSASVLASGLISAAIFFGAAAACAALRDIARNSWK